jgi:hypothetical protein
MLIVFSPSVGGAAFAVPVAVAWIDLTGFERYVWFYLVGAGRGNGPPST